LIEKKDQVFLLFAPKICGDLWKSVDDERKATTLRTPWQPQVRAYGIPPDLWYP